VNLGKRLRLSRIVRPDSGRSLIVAYAHGVLMGPLPGMVNRDDLDRQAHSLRGAEAVIVPPGLARYVTPLFEGRDAPALMILVGWQNMSRSPEQLGYHTGSTAALASIERVAAMGAAGIMTYLFIGFEDPREEAREIEATARIVEECERLGLVLLIESRAVRDERNQDGSFRLDLLKLHTRMAAEIGADLVKTKQPATVDEVRELTESCPCPVLFAGGPLREDPGEAYQVARDAIEGGAAGLVYGRNTYQQEDPAVALKTFSDIVHSRGRHDRRVRSE